MKIKDKTIKGKANLEFNITKNSSSAINELEKNYNIGQKWGKDFDIKLKGKTIEELHMNATELYLIAKELDGFVNFEVSVEESFSIK